MADLPTLFSTSQINFVPSAPPASIDDIAAAFERNANAALAAAAKSVTEEQWNAPARVPAPHGRQGAGVLRPDGRRQGLRRRGVQAHDEHRALPDFAAHVDRAAVRLDQPSRDREAEADAAVLRDG